MALLALFGAAFLATGPMTDLCSWVAEPFYANEYRDILADAPTQEEIAALVRAQQERVRAAPDLQIAEFDPKPAPIAGVLRGSSEDTPS